MIKLKKSILLPGSQFLNALNAVANQTFGAKQDSALFPVVKRVMDESKDFNALRERYVKEYLTMGKNGEYTTEGVSPEALKEFNDTIAELSAGEFELPIETPVLLVRRKKHSLSPLIAAVLSDVITVVWGTDDGEHLDQDDKKN